MNMINIMYPKTIEYYFMKQRPHHLMEEFGRKGLQAYFFNLGMGIGNAPKKGTGIHRLGGNFNLVEGVGLRHSRPYIYYYSYPVQVNTIERKIADFIIFDSVDHPSGPFKHWAKDYRRAIGTADLVLASSKNLYNEALKFNDNVLYIPNGVDMEHFKKARDRSAFTLPERFMRQLEGPVIGYYGAIGQWVDTDLIEYTADKLEDCTLLIIGPGFGKSVDYRENIVSLPHRPYEDLPKFLSLFDVCIIPFDPDSEVVKSCNPLKYWEYLAAGKPVVTTNMPECQWPVSYSSNDYDEFVEKIKEAINESNRPDYTELVKSRYDLAEEHGWGTLVDRILTVVRELRPEWSDLL